MARVLGVEAPPLMFDFGIYAIDRIPFTAMLGITFR